MYKQIYANNKMKMVKQSKNFTFSMKFKKM